MDDLSSRTKPQTSTTPAHQTSFFTLADVVPGTLQYSKDYAPLTGDFGVGASGASPYAGGDNPSASYDSIDRSEAGDALVLSGDNEAAMESKEGDSGVVGINRRVAAPSAVRALDSFDQSVTPAALVNHVIGLRWKRREAERRHMLALHQKAVPLSVLVTERLTKGANGKGCEERPSTASVLYNDLGVRYVQRPDRPVPLPLSPEEEEELAASVKEDQRRGRLRSAANAIQRAKDQQGQRDADRRKWQLVDEKRDFFVPSLRRPGTALDGRSTVSSSSHPTRPSSATHQSRSTPNPNLASSVAQSPLKEPIGWKPSALGQTVVKPASSSSATHKPESRERLSEADAFHQAQTLLLAARKILANQE